MKFSKKLDKWFSKNENHPEFCDFMYGKGLFDESYTEGKDYGAEAISMGYDLAKRAGTHSVYECNIDSGTLWFIGEEDEILSYLEEEWKAHLAELPAEPSPLDKAKDELQQVKKRIKDLKNLEKRSAK